MANWPSGDVTLLLHQDNILFSVHSLFIKETQKHGPPLWSFELVINSVKFLWKKNKKIKMWIFTDNQNIYQKLFSIAGKYQ